MYLHKFGNKFFFKSQMHVLVGMLFVQKSNNTSNSVCSHFYKRKRVKVLDPTWLREEAMCQPNLKGHFSPRSEKRTTSLRELSSLTQNRTGSNPTFVMLSTAEITSDIFC